MTFAVFVLIAVAALWALLGLGGAWCRITGYRAGTWAETIGIGLAGLICAGGVLNLCRVSFGPVYDGLLVAGMIAAFWTAPKKPPCMTARTGLRYPAVSSALILGALWLIGHAELPPSAFNYHDDFEKYFVHPVRMLQTGTVFGSPLSAIGTETLGGQAVLHGIAVHHFAVPYLFAVDGLFALLLCLLMVLAVVPDRPGRFLLALLCVATACVVNPVMINVSSIYTTSALIMTAVLVCRSLYLGDAGCSRRSTLPLLLGMLFAALLALKSINAVYLLTVFAAAAAMQLTVQGKDGIRPAPGMGVFATFGATVLFLLPWLLLHAPHYLTIGSGTLDGDRFAAMGAPHPEPIDLVSFDPLFYGSSYAHYSLLILIVAVYCVGFYILSRRQGADRRTSRGWLLACGAALPVSAALVIALGPQLNGYETNVRYTAPLLIAGGAIFLPLALSEARRTNGRAGILWIAAMTICGLFVIGLYSGQFASRVRQSDRFGNSLAFSGNATDPDYLAYNREVLYGTGAGQMRKIQEVVPAGASVLAWVTTPYHLDFSRNRIYDVEQAGVGNPWAVLPRTDYVMYQYEGYAVPPLELIYYDLRHPGRRERQVGRNAMAVIDAIEGLWVGAPELYNDGEVVVFRVAGN